MSCPRCKSDLYPDQCKLEENRKYCKTCDYPRLSPEARKRIGGKLQQIKHLIVLHPKNGSTPLKGIHPKYFGETLDPFHRPIEELALLYKEWDKNYSDAPNFYDYAATRKPINAKVLQLNEEQRVEYTVTIKNGELHGEHVSKTHMDHAFVLDPLGNFYAAPKQTSGDVRIHHSSFLSGAPVQCAGVFFCNQNTGPNSKKIFYVKDYSGHYTPGIPEILRLKTRLVDLGEGAVHLWYYGGGLSPKWKGPIEKFTGNGEDFIS